MVTMLMLLNVNMAIDLTMTTRMMGTIVMQVMLTCTSEQSV